MVEGFHLNGLLRRMEDHVRPATGTSAGRSQERESQNPPWGGVEELKRRCGGTEDDTSDRPQKTRTTLSDAGAEEYRTD
ncbi:hypothetical protein EYF80_038661 [Liparis tanakae]|uniref:Uncharacterized protein n=1 Tax=Liparis tanakae TaxID=230148 RepID=A0A4Z2GD04_9TELE|nr:hypothetical protein EYF80_038661 [Liparis tanakae]